MKKTKSRGKKRQSQDSSTKAEMIIIDESMGLIFQTEKDLFGYFEPYIQKLEKTYQEQRSKDDFTDQEQLKLEVHLEATLDEPDEIWKDDNTFSDMVIHYFIKKIDTPAQEFYYVAIAYVSTEDHYPTFVFHHFPTKIKQTLEFCRRSEIIYDKKYEKLQSSALEGDAVTEGDPFAMGLIDAMLKVRSEKDIPESDFKKFADLRDETIESGDEIWRKNDLEGNVLVTFIKEYPDHEVKDLYYVVVTQEDPQSNVHSLLFSFPTTDKTLVDRYRQGENLQAEDVEQESSH